ncbi:MAG: hypothetical protein WC944_04760, partial [Candidatus Cloacimonadaceae bacterium]|nr:hypothetical protein [Candidatus Cloacimonadota bacterium]
MPDHQNWHSPKISSHSFDKELNDSILAVIYAYVFQFILLAVKIHDSSINIFQSESHRDGILDSNLRLHKVIESCRDGISDSKHRPVHNQTLVKWGNACHQNWHSPKISSHSFDNELNDSILAIIYAYVFQFILLAVKIHDSS